MVNPSISPDGRYAVYSSWVLHGDTQWDRHFEVYVRDLKQGTETLVSTGLPGTTTTLGSYGGRITADDRWVVFSSEADNLVPGDATVAPTRPAPARVLPDSHRERPRRGPDRRRKLRPPAQVPVHRRRHRPPLGDRPDDQ